MELRGYFFGHRYLSSIQQGIQGQHADTRAFVKYPQTNRKLKKKVPLLPDDYLHQWAAFHETSVYLNGGICATLKELLKFFDKDSNPFPWCPFYEDEATLNGALTCVHIVLPDYIFRASPETIAVLEAGNRKHPDKYARQIFKRHPDDVKYLIELIRRVQAAPLAQ